MNILFDETQNERGKIYDNFEKLAKLIEKEGHKVSTYTTHPIKTSEISEVDVIVFLCPDGSKLYGHEVKALLRFVDEGGSLAIFANAGGDKGLNTNLNTLLKHFDIEIIANQIFDNQHFDLELESNAIVSKFYEHPITAGLSEITLVSSCSLSIGKNVGELARTQNSSDPPSATVMAITSYGLGTVFVCGSYLMFSDRKSGIKLRDNEKLAKNIFTNIAVPAMKTVEEVEKEVIEEIPKKEKVKPKVEEEKQIESPIQKLDMVKEVLDKGEPDTVKAEVLKAMRSLKEEIKKPDVEVKEPKLQKDDIYEAIAVIQELEKDIELLKIEDPGYRDILLTDMARRRGIDYTQVMPYLEKLRDKEKRKKSKLEEKIEEEVEAIEVESIPTPTPIEQFEKDMKAFDERMEAKKTALQGNLSDQIATELVQSIKELKNSVDVLSANLIHLLSEIVLEIKEAKGKKKLF